MKTCDQCKDRSMVNCPRCDGKFCIMHWYEHCHAPGFTGSTLGSGAAVKVKGRKRHINFMFPPPEIGAIQKCLVCALEKPWAIFDQRTGAAVCVDCRDAPAKLRDVIWRLSNAVEEIVVMVKNLKGNINAATDT